jgi:type I restriction enzyme, S subunit
MAFSPKRPGMTKVATSAKLFRFDQMARLINDRVDNPAESGVERYVGLEHLDAESLRIRRWGEITDVESTKLRFKPGDIIFGKRRVYQRKLAVADFEGICSAHAMVLRAKPDVVLPEFLPFFMRSDCFMDRALAISVGSLSPTINWNALAREEFALPPIEVQRRMVHPFAAYQETVDWLMNIELCSDHLLKAYMNQQVFHLLGDFRFRPERIALVTDRVIRLEELCTEIVDCLHRTPKYSETGVIAIRTCDVLPGKLLLQEAYRVSDEEYQIQTSRLTPEPGDILFSREAPMGNAAVVPGGTRLCISQRMMHMRLRPEISPNYTVEVLNSQFVRDQIERVAVGSTVLHINVEDVKKLWVPVFDKPTFELIAERIATIRDAQQKIEAKRRSAAALGQQLSDRVIGQVT